ncbi:MAG: Rnf-Nqr domain containing protein [Candidatus Eutrophobiaceae bacterium]
MENSSSSTQTPVGTDPSLHDESSASKTSTLAARPFGIHGDRFELIVLASAPLLVVVDSFQEAIGVGLLAVIALLPSALAVNLLRRHIPPAQHFALLLITSSGVLCIIALWLAAVNWQLYMSLKPVLPFLLFNNFAFSCLECDCLNLKFSPAMRQALTQSLCLLALCLVCGGLQTLLMGMGLVSPGAALTLLLLAFLLIGVRLALRQRQPL